MKQLDVLGLIKAVQNLERDASIALMYSGLRIAQYRLLELVDREADPTVTQISRQLNITRASASVMVNELTRSGILVFEENPSDRRSFHIRMTTPGRNKLQVARKDLAVFLERLSGRYSSEMMSALNHFAQRELGH